MPEPQPSDNPASGSTLTSALLTRLRARLRSWTEHTFSDDDEMDEMDEMDEDPGAETSPPPESEPTAAAAAAAMPADSGASAAPVVAPPVVPDAPVAPACAVVPPWTGLAACSLQDDWRAVWRSAKPSECDVHIVCVTSDAAASASALGTDPDWGGDADGAPRSPKRSRLTPPVDVLGTVYAHRVLLWARVPAWRALLADSPPAGACAGAGAATGSLDFDEDMGAAGASGAVSAPVVIRVICSVAVMTRVLEFIYCDAFPFAPDASVPLCPPPLATLPLFEWQDAWAIAYAQLNPHDVPAHPVLPVSSRTASRVAAAQLVAGVRSGAFPAPPPPAPRRRRVGDDLLNAAPELQPGVTWAHILQVLDQRHDEAVAQLTREQYPTWLELWHVAGTLGLTRLVDVVTDRMVQCMSPGLARQLRHPRYVAGRNGPASLLSF